MLTCTHIIHAYTNKLPNGGLINVVYSQVNVNDILLYTHILVISFLFLHYIVSYNHNTIELASPFLLNINAQVSSDAIKQKQNKDPSDN